MAPPNSGRRPSGTEGCASGELISIDSTELKPSFAGQSRAVSGMGTLSNLLHLQPYKAGQVVYGQSCIEYSVPVADHDDSHLSSTRCWRGKRQSPLHTAGTGPNGVCHPTQGTSFAFLSPPLPSLFPTTYICNVITITGSRPRLSPLSYLQSLGRPNSSQLTQCRPSQKSSLTWLVTRSSLVRPRRLSAALRYSLEPS